MSSFTTIDSNLLELVSGGVKVEADAKTKVGEGSVKVDTDSRQNTDPSTYLRCLDLVKSQSGMFESNQTIEARQERQCGPYRTKETQ